MSFRFIIEFSKSFFTFIIVLFVLTIHCGHALVGTKWNFTVSNDGNNAFLISRPLFKNSNVSISGWCDTNSGIFEFRVFMDKIECWQVFPPIIGSSRLQIQDVLDESNEKTKPKKFPVNCTNNSASWIKIDDSITPVDDDGVYFLRIHTKSNDSQNYRFTVIAEMKGPHGYLSAADWPLLRFYGAMCIVYLVFAATWLVVSFLQWRDLLRIQFWIGAVILIGMIEKAVFYEAYDSMNNKGKESPIGLIFVAELVSVAKRSLARMLVIIVSLGYGIVKPRLGSHLPKILATGAAYFVLASLESYLRLVRPTDTESSNLLLLASIALLFLDSFICWWIFSSLIQTTRTLRLRRNIIKLRLYTYFTNTLIFAVAASTVFMIYSINTFRRERCISDWQDVWVDTAFWPSLFSTILFVIMVLWRPTNNNQRYAFSPLLDAPEDDDEDDEEVEHFVNDSYGVKMRGLGSNRSDSPKLKNTSNLDDDLKWVEENIPSSFIDSTLPVLDSDEELMNTKFEISKME